MQKQCQPHQAQALNKRRRKNAAANLDRRVGDADGEQWAVLSLPGLTEEVVAAISLPAIRWIVHCGEVTGVLRDEVAFNTDSSTKVGCSTSTRWSERVKKSSSKSRSITNTFVKGDSCVAEKSFRARKWWRASDMCSPEFLLPSVC